MKRFYIWILICLLIGLVTLVFLHDFGDQTTPEDQIVYITDTVFKYHRAGCRYLKHSEKTITREKAERRGYQPCKVCKP